MRGFFGKCRSKQHFEYSLHANKQGKTYLLKHLDETVPNVSKHTKMLKITKIKLKTKPNPQTSSNQKGCVQREQEEVKCSLGPVPT